MAPKNQAAWQTAKKVATYTIGDAPYTPPGKGQVVIRNGAVGINPFDWLLQYVAGLFAPHLSYPTVLGTDCAGTVVEVGPGVTRFKVGDRYVVVVSRQLSRDTNNALPPPPLPLSPGVYLV